MIYETMSLLVYLMETARAVISDVLVMIWVKWLYAEAASPEKVK
jgi:hypothetical protein